MTAAEVKRALGLEPHPREGGWFAETYRTAALVPASTLANTTDTRGYDGPRRFSTAIYYLLEPTTFSEMHRLASDEIFHHYAGVAVEMLQLWPNGRAERVVIGKDLLAGQRPQVLVPKGVWQGSRLLPAAAREGTPGDAWALMGCTVSPGFEYADYETGLRSELVERYPEAEATIVALTHT